MTSMRSRWLVLLLAATASLVSSSYDSLSHGEYAGSCKHAYGHYYNERGKQGKAMHKRHKTDKVVIYPPASYPQELSPVDWTATKVRLHHKLHHKMCLGVASASRR